MNTDMGKAVFASIFAAFLIVLLSINSSIISRVIDLGWRSNVAAVGVTSPYTIFDGDSNSWGSSCAEYAEVDQGSGVGGSASLKLEPDQWHAPRLKIYCGGRDRQDIGGAQTLTFMIRSDSPNPDPLTVSFYTYYPSPQRSARVSVNGISSNWTQISIPISSFKTSWDLSQVDDLDFDVSPSSSVYYVDNITLLPPSTPPTNPVTPPTNPTAPANSTNPTNPVTPVVPTISSTTPVTPATTTPVVPTTVAAPTSLVPSSFLAAVDLTKQFEIWNGETSGERPTAPQFGKIISSGAAGGTYAFQASPDQWHASVLNLSSAASYRQNLSGYDYLQMSVKAVPNSGATLPAVPSGVFSIYAWPNTSASIPLESYIVGGGTFDGTYKTVRIPMSALKVSGGYDLSSIEYLNFSIPGGSTPTYSFDIDNIYAVKATSNQLTGVQTVSDSVLKLVAKDRYDMNAVLVTSHYILSSSDDQNYSGGKSPLKIGRQMFLTGFDGSTGGSFGLSSAPLVEPDLYLLLPAPLKNGTRYTLTVTSLPDIHGNDLAANASEDFTYMDKTVTGSVQANQVGYLPISPKFAYIGNYLGDAGALGGVPSTCQIVNTVDGSIAGTFTPTHRGLDLKLSGNDVYSCDFSSVIAPGTYYVYVPGFGTSYNFQIGSNVLASVARKIADLYYNQRADAAISDGQWSRPAGTLSSDQKVSFYPVDFTSSDYNPLALSKTDYPDGTTYDMTGGWYDAGDFGKYTLPAAAPINDLLFAYELFPQKFTDGQADIPESSDGIPDILNEVKYEMDWFQKMQGKDGGAFDRVTATTWETSPYDIEPRFIGPETTQTTAVYAAALAQGYRVFKGNAAFESKYPGYADGLLAKAKKAWSFLAAHPTPQPANGTDVAKLGIGGGDYQDNAYSNCGDGQTPGSTCPYSDVDNRAWAAAELYKSTGDSAYSDAFVKYWSQTDPFNGLYNNFVYDNAKASLTYVTTSKYATDPTIIAKIKAAYAQVANEIYGYTYSNTYRDGYRLDVPDYISWGQYAQSAAKSYDLIKAYIILGDAKYLDAAKINLDVELGANPQNMSYITGVGSDSPQNPLHLTSIWLRQNSGAADPVPGIPVFGPSNWASEANPSASAAQSDANIYPSLHAGDYPILRRYFDASPIVEQSEFGINTSAPILAAFSYFAR